MDEQVERNEEIEVFPPKEVFAFKDDHVRKARRRG